MAPLGVEDVLKLMGANLRTNVKERKRGKFSGKDNLYIHFEAKKKKLKKEIHTKEMKIKRDVLSELDISECDFSISDSTVEMISELFKELEVLKLAKSEFLTDISMNAIARDLNQLHTLDIR